MEIIKDASEIDSAGQYCFTWMSTIITVGTELDKQDNLAYCISIDNLTIMQGWQVKTWKTLKGIQSALDSYMTHQMYGLYPEPPKKMTLEQLKKAAEKEVLVYEIGYR